MLHWRYFTSFKKGLEELIADLDLVLKYVAPGIEIPYTRLLYRSGRYTIIPWPPDPLAPGPMPLTHSEDRFGAISIGNEAHSWSARREGGSPRAVIRPFFKMYALDDEFAL
jgi:hypothetical protein